MYINNLADWAKAKKVVVFRLVDGAAWFYDAWDDYTKALSQAVEIGGQIIPTSEISEA
jgi:hypothetical protein